MVIINGSDPVLVQYLVQRLAERGHTLTPTAPDAHLFSEATKRGATMLVSVEADASSDERLDDLIAAASSPVGPMVVCVTPRRPDDVGLMRLRKSGAPFVVLRFGHMPSWALSRDLENEAVTVGRGLDVPAEGITTGSMLVEALERIFNEDVALGSTFHVMHRTWEEALQSIGATPRPASVLGQYFARWRGRPCLRASGDDVTLHPPPGTTRDGVGRKPTQEGGNGARYHTAA